MSIFSSIGSALSKGYQAVKSAVSSLFTSGTGYNPLTANALTAVPTASASTKNPVTGISKTGGTTYYNNYVPPAYDSKGNVVPNSVSSNYSAINSSGGVGSAPYGPKLPVKISAGSQNVNNVSSSTGLTSGTQDFFYNPESVTLSARTLGVSDGGSTGSLSSPGTQPIQLNTSPSNVSVGQTDSTRLAGGFSRYRKYNATTRQWEDVAAPVEEKQPTLDEKLKERMDLYNKYVGIKPDVYEDPQVIQARNEVNRIKQELRAPTDELNAVIAKQNQDLLQLRQTGAKEGVTEAVYSQQQNAINYNAAIRALPLQANIARIQGNLELAQDYLKEEMNIRQSQIDRQYEYNKARFASIANFLDKEDERTYKEITTANDRAYQEQRDLVKVQTELLQNAVPQGAPMSIQNSIRNAQSIPEAIMAAGRYGGDIAERAYKQVQLENAQLQGQKIKQEIESNQPVTGEYADIINGAAGLVPSTKKTQIKQNIANSLANGDYKTAYAEIANAVSDGITGTNKTKFDDARTDLEVLSNVKIAIQNYANAGGDMGLLKGTAEDIKRKLGIDSGKASALAVQLWREFQTYRSNMTGAAFTPAESRDYAAVNPTLGKSLDLNLNVIDGAINQLGNRVTSTVKARIPAAQKIFDLAYGSDQNNDTVQIKLPDGRIGTIPRTNLEAAIKAGATQI